MFRVYALLTTYWQASVERAFQRTVRAGRDELAVHASSVDAHAGAR